MEPVGSFQKSQGFGHLQVFRADPNAPGLSAMPKLKGGFRA